MQRLDENKRRLITDAAVRLFAQRPFHEVKLDDVAAAARVGKGTLYLYFKNKHDLYVTLIQDGFAELVDGLREQLAGGADEAEDVSDDKGSGNGTGRRIGAWQALERVVGELARFATSHPDLYELMRSVPLNKVRLGKRRQLTDLIEHTIRRGTRAGVMNDPNPALTATFIPAMVRAAMLFGPKNVSAGELSAHIVRLLEKGLNRKEAKCK
jgi:AcrR family transcriptional regulator